MKSIVLNAPITVGGIAFESWEPSRLRTIDCVKVGDVFYFMPIVVTDAIVKRDLERAKAVPMSRVIEWAPSISDLPAELMQRTGPPQPMPVGGKK